MTETGPIQRTPTAISTWILTRSIRGCVRVYRTYSCEAMSALHGYWLSHYIQEKGRLSHTRGFHTFLTLVSLSRVLFKCTTTQQDRSLWCPLRMDILQDRSIYLSLLFSLPFSLPFSLSLLPTCRPYHSPRAPSPTRVPRGPPSLPPAMQCSPPTAPPLPG